MELEAALDVGFEVMKLYQAGHIFLFLAENDWQGGYELVAIRENEAETSVSIKHWQSVIIPTDMNLN